MIPAVYQLARWVQAASHRAEVTKPQMAITARRPSSRQWEHGRFTRSWKTPQADSVAPLPMGRLAAVIFA